MGNKKQEKSLVMKKLILLIAIIGIVCAEDYRQTGLCPKIKEWSTDIAQGVSHCVQKTFLWKSVWWGAEKIGIVAFEDKMIKGLVETLGKVAGCKRRRLNLWDNIKSFTKSAVCKVWNAGVKGTCTVVIKAVDWILAKAKIPAVCAEDIMTTVCISKLSSSCARRRMPLYPY